MHTHNLKNIVLFFGVCFFIYSLRGPSVDMFYLRLSLGLFSLDLILYFIGRIEERYFFMCPDNENHFSQISYKALLYDNRLDLVGILFVLLLIFLIFM